jgi:phosphoglycerate dehydrogenase-like enzyme
MEKSFVMLPPHTETTLSWAARLAQLPTVDVRIARTGDEALLALKDADAAFGTMDPELLAAAGRLTWLQAPEAAPPPGYFFAELVDSAVTVTNFRGVYNDHVATHAVAMALSLARGLTVYRDQQRAHAWTRHLADDDVIHLPQARALIIGVGGIGAEIARMLAAFGTTVDGVDPRRTEPPAGMRRITPPTELDAALAGADIVVLTLPHTPESEGMINRERLGLLPPGAILVNVGRGPTVQLEAVRQALVEGRLRGVGLDVFEEEPLPADHPLWDLPQALITPHVAVVGPEINERRYQVIETNLRRFTAGEPLINVVDKASWY